MSSFQYEGLDGENKRVAGEIKADTEEEVADKLKEKNIIVIKINLIKEEKIKKNKLSSLLNPNPVKTTELLMFCRQMASLAKAGIPIDQSLNSLSQTTHSKVLSNVLVDIVKTVSSGQELSMALQQNPDIFSTLFVSVIKVGESSGHLDVAFKQIGTYLEIESRTNKKVKAALRYPMIVIFTILTALVVINILVIPKFAQLFQSFKAELPIYTKIMMATSNFLQAYWPFLLVVVILLIIAARLFVAHPKGRFIWDSAQLRMPIIGEILKQILLARFGRTFAIIMRAGVPLTQGITLVAGSIGNDFFKKHVLAMREGIEHGEGLTSTARNTGLFSPLVLQMLSVGEQTGSLDVMMDEVADFYDTEADYQLNWLSDLIEPIVLIFVGCLVLVLALGVFLPIWDMATIIKR